MDETLNEQKITLPDTLELEFAKAREAWDAGGNTRRLWSADAGLWSGGDEGHWLGWLDIIGKESLRSDALREFALGVHSDNFTDILLLGMGGSSLGPEVLAETLGSAAGYPRLRVLDSTDPCRVRRFEQRLDIKRTLFIVSSKSGTTLETSVLMDYFFAAASAALGRPAASHFVAITDPGSLLQKVAENKGFRRVFLGVPSIGGRYSVLSSFGMAPLAASGHNVSAFLAAADAMARACGPDVSAAENPGVALGLAIGVAALQGRDKLTLIASPSIGSFGAWAEQLIAESTGKNGKGVIPVEGEPVNDPSVYGTDRLFVYLRDVRRSNHAHEQAVRSLEKAGHPMVRINVTTPELLGQEFFRFEIATAVAGAMLGINPFDQPDVEASKIETRAMTETFEKTGALPVEAPVCSEEGIALFTDDRNAQSLRRAGANSTLDSWLKAHFSRIAAGDYFAVLAYLDAERPRLKLLQGLRTSVRDCKHVATCLQFGPRFLHSTGQAYKGGPNSGVFLEITCEARPDVNIPGRKPSFGIIEAAQARGDFRVLAERGRRILRAHIAGDVDKGLAVLGAAVRRALA